MVNIAFHGHADAAAQSLEDAFDLVVLVVATGLDIQIHAGGVAQTLEEMEEHLGRHAADILAVELGIPHDPGTASEVEHHLTQAVVHRKGETVTLDTALVAQGLAQAFSQSQGHIFNGVVLVYLQVTVHADIQVETAVAGYLLQHMVEETDTGIDVADALSVQIQAHADIGLGGGALHFHTALAGIEDLGNLIPVVNIGNGGMIEGILVTLLQNKGLAAEIQGQLGIGLPVTDHIAAGQIVAAVHILGEHGGAGLAGRLVLLGQGAVDMGVLEENAFCGKHTEHQGMNGHKVLIGESRGSQTVLVAHHDKVIIQILGDEMQVPDHAGLEKQFLKGIYLKIFGLTDQCAVTVDKKQSLLVHVFRCL